jgi:hypothetical protein
MTFADFAQMLFPYLGNRKNQADFVVALVGSIIMETDDGSCTLLDKPSDYLARIFRGTKPFPRKDATFILGHLNKANFEAYVSEFTDDGIEGLGVALSENGIYVTKKYEVGAKCADAFEEILKDCAKNTRKTR